MTDIAIIADQDTLLGFELVGIKNSTIFDEKTIKEELKKYHNTKILILTEKVASYLREHKLLENIKATIAEIPDKSGSTGKALEEISKLFESAVGVKLKGEKNE